MKLLNRVEPLDNIKELNIGDILCIYKDSIMYFYLFLGFNIGFNRDNLLSHYFDNNIKLQSYEYYERDIIDDIGVQSIYYNIIQLGVNKKFSMQEDYNKDIFMIPEKTDKYLLDLIESAFINGSLCVNAIVSCRDFYGNSVFRYKISNVISEKEVKRFILKLQLSSNLAKETHLESYQYIETKLREGYRRRIKQLEEKEKGLMTLIQEERVDENPIPYMLYGKTVKENIRLYICLGYNYKNEVVYLPIEVVPKEELNLKELQIKFNTKYWLDKCIKGKKLLVGYRPFYRIGIQAQVPSTTLKSLTSRKLREVGLIL